MAEHDRRQTDSDKNEIMAAVREAMSTAVRLAIIDHRDACPALQSQPKIDRVYKELFNGDDGEHGFVAEYRKDKIELSKKLGFIHGAAKTWSVVLGALLTAFMGLIVWTFHEVYPAFRQIMADYYAHHPNAKVEQKSISEPPREVYTVHIDSAPQTAGNSEAFTRKTEKITR